MSNECQNSRENFQRATFQWLQPSSSHWRRWKQKHVKARKHSVGCKAEKNVPVKAGIMRMENRFSSFPRALAFFISLPVSLLRIGKFFTSQLSHRDNKTRSESPLAVLPWENFFFSYHLSDISEKLKLELKSTHLQCKWLSEWSETFANSVKRKRWGKIGPRIPMIF